MTAHTQEASVQELERAWLEEAIRPATDSVAPAAGHRRHVS